MTRKGASSLSIMVEKHETAIFGGIDTKGIKQQGQETSAKVILMEQDIKDRVNPEISDYAINKESYKKAVVCTTDYTVTKAGVLGAAKLVGAVLVLVTLINFFIIWSQNSNTDKNIKAVMMSITELKTSGYPVRSK